MPFQSFVLQDIEQEISLRAEGDGLWMRYTGHDPNVCLWKGTVWGESRNESSARRTWRTVVDQLLEQQLIVPNGSDFRIQYDAIAIIEDQGLELFSGLASWAPFTLHIGAHRFFGAPDFQYRYRFLSGVAPIIPLRLGCFLFVGESIYRVAGPIYQLLCAIDEFNALPPQSKTAAFSLEKFAVIKELIQQSGAEADQFLSSTHVILPSKVKVDVSFDSENRISLYPQFDGVPEESIREAFFRLGDVQRMYELPSQDGGRKRVVLNEDLMGVLRVMQKVRHVGGESKLQILADPRRAFEGACDLDLLDLSIYGPRVQGIGTFHPKRADPYIGGESRRIFDRENEPEIGLRYEFPDGSSKSVAFSTKSELKEFAETVEQAHVASQAFVSFDNAFIPVTEMLRRSLTHLLDRLDTPNEKKPKNRADHQYLLIYTNEEAIDHDEGAQPVTGNLAPVLPHALSPNIEVKPHQRDGIGWLQHLYRNAPSRHGCLLADDMGLGKTLQVLAFVAQRLEEIQEQGAECEPILIVCPLMLLPTWEREMSTRFTHGGKIFRPLLSLHGQTLTSIRRSPQPGSDLALQAPTLDLESIRENRVVLTNYETVRNYQYSLAKIRWEMVITDEAQEFKDHTTATSNALKSLYPRFRLALTGTPVENRLSDIWNIMDFLQPGILLGSHREFVTKYEKPAMSVPIEQRKAVLDALRERLHYGRSDAYILRREKILLKGLPMKHPPHILTCMITPEQRNLYSDCLARFREPDAETHAFKLLDRLVKLSQHPFLLDNTQCLELLPPKNYLEASPKLQTVVATVKAIKAAGEKVLVFTRLRLMQDILKLVFDDALKMNVNIINGSPITGRKYIVEDRDRLIKEFEGVEGFNLLILSPDVAGVGLTITGANHVIHYGRWWNPAREAQATDRVYRIGQTRDVHVYYPIDVDPKGELRTFDERLQALLNQKASDARDFLTPIPSEDAMGADMFDDLRQSHPPGGNMLPIRGASTIAKLMPHMFEALVAEVFRHDGKQVVLTPQGGDGGVDIVAMDQGGILLIECKHSSARNALSEEAIHHFVNGTAYYYNNMLPRGSLGKLRQSILVTNSKVDRAFRRLAKEQEIALITEDELVNKLEKLCITPLDVEDSHNLRQRTLADVRQALGQWRWSS